MRNRLKRAITCVLIGVLSCGLLFSSRSSVSAKTAADDGRRTRTESQTCDGNRSGYTVRDVHYGRALMREFIAPTGVVFALDWKGMPEPDVKNLLGSSTDDERLEDLLPILRRRNSTTRISERDIIWEKSGTSRNLYGRAYVPYLVPSGVTIGDVWCDG